MILNNNNNNAIDEIVLHGILTTISANNGSWRGTMTQLNSNLASIYKSKKVLQALPKAPNMLRMIVNKIANRLRSRGISIKFTRTPDKNRTRIVKFIR